MSKQPITSNSSSGTTENQRFLIFSLGKESYAVPLLMVKEVIGLPETTAIPNTPNYFKGVMNLRGQVISIIDLRLKMKQPKAETGGETSVIIMDFSPLCLGAIVDSIDSVMSVSTGEIAPPPDLESSLKNKSISGVVKKDSKLILLLDMRGALNTEDFNALKSQTQRVA